MLRIHSLLVATIYSWAVTAALAQPPDDPSWIPVPKVGDSAAVALTGCAGDCSCESECPTDPWRLFPEAYGWSLSGWLQGGVTASADDPASRSVRPVGLNDREEAQFNQLYAIFERPIDTTCGWDVGGRVDFLYGTDARFTEVPGLEQRQDGSDHWNSRTFYRASLPQMYAEIGSGDLSVRVGHWYTTIGYEVIPGPSNFFYSHDYAMLYAQPFTHTGVIGTYSYSEQLSFYGAVHNGWNSFDATTNRAALLTGFNWTSCDERLGVAVALTTGDEINSQGVYSERSLYSFVVNYHVTSDLEYVIQHDNGWQEDDGGADVDAEWYGINQYLLYTVNDCWAAGARFEWFRDDDGIRVPDFAGNTGFAGDFYEVTLGLRWTRDTNIIVRPEIRWDWYDGMDLPFDDGTQDDQFTAAVDAIVLF